jgi:hypothetical protein
MCAQGQGFLRREEGEEGEDPYALSLVALSRTSLTTCRCSRPIAKDEATPAAETTEEAAAPVEGEVPAAVDEVRPFSSLDPMSSVRLYAALIQAILTLSSFVQPVAAAVEGAKETETVAAAPEASTSETPAPAEESAVKFDAAVRLWLSLFP